MKFLWKYKFLTQLFVVWLIIAIFFIGNAIIYKRNQLQDFILPLRAKQYPSEFLIQFNTFYTQPDNITCGPTSAAMFLNHYGKEISVNEMKLYTRTVWYEYNETSIGMTLPGNLSEAITKFGIKTKIEYGNLHYLKSQVSQNKPCIVLVRSSETTWHYFVVIGYNSQHLFVAEPSFGGIRYLSTEQFLDCWGWKTDIDGAKCDSKLSQFLQFIDVLPYTMISF
jgi:ABC-type bacteriocin/lantibiotic exporter with double-glycine peptidase domain